MEDDGRKRKTSSTLEEYFDLKVFNDITAAQVSRGREELSADYELFTERIKLFDESEKILKEDLFTRQAAERIRDCVDISENLRKSNEEETVLLTGLEDLIENLIFKLETIHHVRNEPDTEEVVSDEKEYDEDYAETEMKALFEDCAKYKSAVQKNIGSCNDTLSKLKMEISDLVNNNPRGRRMSRNIGMLKFVGSQKSNVLSIANNWRRTTISQTPETEAEEFNPKKDVSHYTDDILKFIKEQEIPDDEANPIISKVHTLSKTLEHFKEELKTANQKSTEDQIKVNNLQVRLPKLEESRVRLSQQCDSLRDEMREKDTTIAKLNIRLNTMEAIGRKTMESPTKEQEEESSVKQAIIPKAVLKDVLQASDKEVEEKLAKLASSNEAVKVCLVRKNKQIRQLEGTIIQYQAEVKAQKQKITELQEDIVSGTADIESIKQQQGERVTTPDQQSSPSTPTIPNVERQSPPQLEDSAASSPDNTPEDVVTIDRATNTHVNKMADGYTQTDEPVSERRDIDSTPDLGDISFRLDKQKPKRKPSLAKIADTAIRRASQMRGSRSDTDSRRGSTMEQSDIFGIGSPSRVISTQDIAKISEFDRTSALNEKTVKQVEDVAVLQKYIASMREQAQKSMEKVREFISKEKQRNEATSRKLINEHEKVLTSHKKEMNKVYHAVHRFREMIIEVLNGKELTQIMVQPNFKYEQSPLQLRIQSSEMLSSLEFEIYQALKEKNMKIRDLSGKKRLDDRDLDRRIKKREKTVFSLLDHTNERLRKEKERVNIREQWVNNKIKTELQYEKHQELEVQTIEKALVRFWREYNDSVQAPSGDAKPPFHLPDTILRSDDEAPPPEHEATQRELQTAAQKTSFGFESVVPKLYISVSNHKENLANLDVAHRAGLMSNLAHKLITNIIARYLDLTEQKIHFIFKAYIKYRRYTNLQIELMNDEAVNDEAGEAITDMNRAMVLHRKVRDALDLQYKKLHVELGKLSTYCGAMLEEEENFYATLPDHRITKNLVRPAMLHINPNAMLKKIMQVVPESRDLHAMFPNMSGGEVDASRALPANIEDIPVLQQVAKTKKSGHWKTDVKDIPAKSLLIPRLQQLDTDKLIPVRLQKHPTQSHISGGLVRKYVSGLPPIPLYSTMNSQRISYLPTICSVWSKNNDNKEH